MAEVVFIDENSGSELHFDQGGEVQVFDQTSSAPTLIRTVIVSQGTKVTWFGLVAGDGEYSLRFETQSGESIVRMLLLAGQEEKLTMTLHSTLVSSHTVTNMHILSLVGESGSVILNGTVQIDAGVEKVKGHILEENIFLGSKGTIRGIPSLLVHSDDVLAGHAARIERVSDEKLYYLRSRGIPKDDATVMMVESAVSGLFEGLEAQHQEKIIEKVSGMF